MGAIEIDGLHCGFGTKKVLNGISCTFEEGSFYALMGANGCGKTTLLKNIAHLIEPQQGSIRIMGRDVREYGARQLAQTMAFVQQHPQTDLEFSAFEIVLMGRNPYQRRLQNESQGDWKVVEESMRQTGTWHLRFAKPSEMSGGELQRVMIARALAQQSPLLLLDEPLANLDIAHQFEIMELLQRLRNTEGLQHRTILLVIHDLNLALQYCEQLLLLQEGRVFFQGNIEEGLTAENIRKVFGVDAEVRGRSIRFNGRSPKET